MSTTEPVSRVANVIQPPPLAMEHTFTFSPALEAYNKPLSQILAENIAQDVIAVGAFVFKAPPPQPQSQSAFPNEEELQRMHAGSAGLQSNTIVTAVAESRQLLVIRRSPAESHPGTYEVPGGGAEPPPIDATLLESVARELFEETGLVAKRIVRLIGSSDFQTGKGYKCRKFNFQVEVQDTERVVLHPAEHDDYRWIGLDELLKLEECGESLLSLVPAQRDAIVNAFAGL
ncbi:hypothetical protein DRE_04563 [Drechslerella stenobrocha 248]|uniref:Nudix hydrolase domain-containing protein n=1 Tax=Drechslerella stenobrocha 248 TaxID=1043628 RepID=W7IAS6_9PEZI|nr:hypothetical protein DRE_04563 [Drechslerella stenobrocha 248]